MAQFIITVPDEVVPRIRAALGGEQPATLVQVQEFIKTILKQRVQQYESARAATQVNIQVNAENWS